MSQSELETALRMAHRPDHARTPGGRARTGFPAETPTSKSPLAYALGGRSLLEFSFYVVADTFFVIHKTIKSFKRQETVNKKIFKWSNNTMGNAAVKVMLFALEIIENKQKPHCKFGFAF